MKNDLIAVVLTFKGKLNDNFFKIKKIFSENDINYLNKKSAKPHLTIASGHINKNKILKLCQKLKKKRMKYLKLRSIGLNMILSNEPLIYIKWNLDDDLINFHQDINIVCKEFFKDKSINSSLNNWLPKTSLAYKDITYTKLPRIMKQLKKFDLYKSVKAENLEIMEITQAGEKTINKIKLV